MIAPHSQTSLARTVVGLAPSMNNDAALEVAVSMAKATGTKVMAIFVEEADALHAANFPFAKTFQQTGLVSRSITVEDMQEAVERQINRCTRVLSSIAGKEHVEWSFVRESGNLAAEISAVIQAGDTLVLVRDVLTGSLASQITLFSSLPKADLALVLGTDAKGVVSASSVVAVIDAASDQESVLKQAAVISRSRRTRLHVILVADDPEATPLMRERANRLLAADAIDFDFTVCPPDRKLLLRLLNRISPSFACFGASSSFLKNPLELKRFIAMAKPRFVIVPETRIPTERSAV